MIKGVAIRVEFTSRYGNWDDPMYLRNVEGRFVNMDDADLIFVHDTRGKMKLNRAAILGISVMRIYDLHPSAVKDFEKKARSRTVQEIVVNNLPVTAR